MSRFEDIYPLLQEYDMFTQSIELIKSPNVYKALTPYGAFVCKRTSAPPGRIQVIGGILRNLQRRGWDGAVPITYTKFGEPYVTRGKSTYYLTAWTPSQGINETQIDDWAQQTAIRLAELHHLTQNFRFDDPHQIDPLVESLFTRWDTFVNQAERLVSYATARNYPSPFDVVFLANQSFLLETAKQAIQMLQDWHSRRDTYSHFRLSVIHGFSHPSHTLIDRQGKVKLINFDRSGFDTPIRDLSIFYRTYFQLGGEAQAANQLHQRYCSVFPLRPEESSLLAAFLSFPERVLKTVEGYYGNHWQTANMSELQAVKRLEKDIDRFLRLCRWIESDF